MELHFASGTAENTLEARQFFKSRRAVSEFVRDTRMQRFQPPYQYIFVVDVDDRCLAAVRYDIQELDRFEAVTVYEADLPAFNNCVNFIKQDGI